MHGGLHRAELATVLVMQGGAFRHGVVSEEPADLTDIVPTILYMLGIETTGMEGRPLRSAYDQSANFTPVAELHEMPRGFVLEAMRGPTGRLYPTALRRAS
jgi:arylsulfatase A-like enzyme